MALDEYTQGRVVALHPDTCVYDAARAMEDNHIGAVILREGRDLVGLVTDRDICFALIHHDEDPLELTLRSIASRPVEVLPVTASVDEAADAMVRRGIRRIPIVDGDALVGIVTLDDLLADEAVDVARLAAIVRAQLSVGARLKRWGERGPSSPVHYTGRAAQERREQRHRARRDGAYDRLIARALHATRLRERQDVELALDQVLRGLLARIQPTEARQLLAQLPAVLRERLASAAAGPDRSVTRAELERTLSARLNIERTRAAELLHQIGSVLTQSLGRGELGDVRSQLPLAMKEILPGEAAEHRPV